MACKTKRRGEFFLYIIITGKKTHNPGDNEKINSNLHIIFLGLLKHLGKFFMKTENILSIEESGENRINLVRDRLFWQAWNKSAFLFSTHIKNYQVHKRFVQKVSQEVAWLGFPFSALQMIQEIATNKGFAFEQKSPDHIIINAVPQTTGYEEWWAKIVKKKPKPAEPNFQIPKNSRDSILPAYKTAYDLCLHIHRATLKMPREFRYELGARIRNHALDITENLHLMANNVQAKPELTESAAQIHKLRLDMRVLKDLQQMGIEQLLSLCNELETRTYELRPGICFINELPVKREIIAADFRDRVVHHFLYNRIYPVLDRKFIYDSYSCRVGKGTLFGIERVRGFLKACENPWVLRLDIKGFFMAINREILFNLIIKGLDKKMQNLDLFLIHRIVLSAQGCCWQACC